MVPDFEKYWENLNNHERFEADKNRVQDAFYFAAKA